MVVTRELPSIPIEILKLRKWWYRFELWPRCPSLVYPFPKKTLAMLRNRCIWYDISVTHHMIYYACWLYIRQRSWGKLVNSEKLDFQFQCHFLLERRWWHSASYLQTQNWPFFQTMSNIVRPSAASFRRAGWIAANKKSLLGYINSLLTTFTRHRDAGEELLPPVREFKEFIEKDPVVFTDFVRMFERATESVWRLPD